MPISRCARQRGAFKLVEEARKHSEECSYPREGAGLSKRGGDSREREEGGSGA